MPRSPAAVLNAIHLDRHPGPRYRQLVCAVRDAILDGRLRPQARLPPSRELAVQLDLARNTIITAYELLQAEGYITSRVGAGSFVTADMPQRPPVPARRPRPEAGPGLSKRGRWHLDFERSPGPASPRIFTPGIPDLRSFPVDVWRRLLSRSWRQAGRQLLQPSDRAGWLPLRRAIAAHIGPARGVRCTPDQGMLVTSSRQAVYLAATVLADPGDEAWIEDPAYIDARSSLLAAGLSLVPVRVDGQGLDVERGIARAPKARLAVVTPSNHYPLGVTLSLARRLRLLEWARQAKAWIIEDDYDGEYRYTGRPLTALQGLDDDDRVIYVGSFSKTMFPTLRIAFLVCPEALIDAVHAARRPIDGPPATASQGALADFIEAGFFAAHVKQMRALYAERQAALVQKLEAAFGGALGIEGQQAGIHLLARLPRAVSDTGLVDAIADPGVRPVPLSRYVLEGRGAGGLVLGYGNSDIRELTRGVTALKRAWDAVRMA